MPVAKVRGPRALSSVCHQYAAVWGRRIAPPRLAGWANMRLGQPAAQAHGGVIGGRCQRPPDSRRRAGECAEWGETSWRTRFPKALHWWACGLFGQVDLRQQRSLHGQQCGPDGQISVNGLLRAVTQLRATLGPEELHIWKASTWWRQRLSIWGLLFWVQQAAEC